jgi:hypothetical protein
MWRMDFRMPLLRDERIGRFLDAVVKELVGAGTAQNKSPTDGLPECGVYLFF